MEPMITAAQLAALMGLPGNTVRWQCREPTGLLYGIAVKVGRDWMIPEASAAEFIRTYKPYGTLSKGDN